MKGAIASQPVMRIPNNSERIRRFVKAGRSAGWAMDDVIQFSSGKAREKRSSLLNKLRAIGGITG
jgi:hypothetical protein